MKHTDARLVARAQAGSSAAWSELLRRHRRLVDGHAARFFFCDADHDDVAQEALIGFCQAVECYRGGEGSSFRGFARLCVGRRLAQALEAAGRAKHAPLDGAQRTASEDGGPIVETLPGSGGDPLAEALRRERLDELLGRAEGFSSLERAAIAHALVGCGAQETARRLGRRRKVVDNALKRAKGKLAWGCAA